MPHYQYSQQPWTERAYPGTHAVQSAQPTGGSQPVSEPQPTGRATQQPSYAESTVEAGQPRPSRQATTQYVSQPTQQAPAFAPAEAQPRQVPQAEPQRTVKPAVASQVQLPPRTGWAQQQLPARTEWTQPPAQTPEPLSTQRTGVVQAAGSEAPSGMETAGAGQATGQAQPTGGEQAMATVPESQTEQQAQATSFAKGMPSVDIYETPDEVIVFADVPGCTPDDIDLLGNESSVTLVANRGDPSITNGKSIQRERVGEVERTIALPAMAEIDEAEATVDDGVCRVTLPKSEDDRAKRIGIQ